MDTDPIELLTDLIRCQSITPNEGGALSLLEKTMNKHGFVCNRLTFGEDEKKVENLFARIGDGLPHLCFAGHTDVVPEGDASEWSYPPFEAKIKDNIIYGRGAVDMKGGIASFLAAVFKYLKETPNFKGSISFLITGDEEGLALNGTKKVLEWMDEKNQIPDLCIVGEPTNLNKIGDNIKIGRRGSLSGKLIVFGKQGHVAYPHLAENPFLNLIKMLKPLLKGTMDNGTKHFPSSTASITSIDTGNQADNVIPSKVETKFNIRFNDLHTKESLQNKILKHFDSITNNYEIKFFSNADPFITKPGFLTSNLKEAIFKITQNHPDLSTSGGTSDARFISKYCPVIEFGLVGKTMHQVDERVPTSDIKMLTNIYYEFLKKNFEINRFD